MRTSKMMSLSAATLIGMATVTGCGASSDAPRTVIVTETAATSGADATSAGSETAAGSETSAGDPTSAGPVTSPGDSTSAGTPTSAGDPTSAGASESMAPVVKVDPLKADCTQVLNSTELGTSFGQLPAGTKRLLEAANPDRQITGRLKCQYGVADSGTVAVQVVLAQFASQEAAEAQMELTATSERQAGAQDSTTTVMGHPANVLLRDGGLLVVGYDTWTLSVVVADGILTDDKLPAALEATAAYSLNQVIVNG